jgi:hypothetical protein
MFQVDESQQVIFNTATKNESLKKDQSKRYISIYKRQCGMF